MLRLKHILSILFLVMATSVLAQETYVIDSVCVGAERTYRRDGEQGYLYDWFIIDTLAHDTFAVPGVDFSEIVGTDTTWGNEIIHIWDAVGEFDILVYVTSEHGCDTLEQGMVKVFELPGVDAGVDQTICSMEDIVLTQDTAWNYSGMYWESTGDGAFSDTFALHPTYYLGSADSASGSVTLIITAYGLADNITCDPVVDSVTFFFSDPEIELLVNDVLCYGDSSAFIKTNVTGGIAPYQYEWTGPEGFTASSDSISGLITGTYILTVTDDNGCTTTDSTFINQPEEILLSIDSVHNLSCYQSFDGFILSSATGGTDTLIFNWTGYSGYTASGNEIYGLPADTFVVTVTDANGCEVIDTVVVSEPDEFIANIDTIIDVQCYEAANGAAHVEVTGGTSPFVYEWDNDPALDSSWVFNLIPGEHTVIITDVNGCTSYDTLTISEPDPILLTLDSLDIRCGGKKPGWIDLEVSGGTPFIDALGQPYYLYEWSDSTGTVFATTQDVDSITSEGLYSVWVEDSLGCRAWSQIYINEVKNIELLATVDSARCYGDLWSIDLTVSRGRKPYTYAWTDSAGVVIATTEDLTGVSAGIYWVTVNDKDSCDESLEFNFEQLEELTVDLIAEDTTTCDGGAILAHGNPLGGTGVLTSLWSGDGAVYLDRTDTSDVIFSGAPTGLYQLIYTVTDANNCVASDSIELEVLPTVVAYDTMQVCEGDFLADWNGRVISSLVDSVYLDTLTTQNGCDSIAVLTVSILPTNGSDSTAVVCEGELIAEWNGQIVSSLADSVYRDTLINQFGCDSLVSLSVTIVPTNGSDSTKTVCEGEILADWNGQTILSTQDSVYLDTLINQYGCDSVVTLSVSVIPPTFSIDTMELCEGSGPIAWNNRTILSTVDSVYLDTLVNAVGCDSMLTMQVTILPVNDTIIDTALCTGTPAYVWNGLTVVSDKDSTYEALLTNQYGCDSVVTLNVTILSPTYSVEDTTLCEGEPVFAWNSHTVQTDRDSVYLDTLVNAAGCDSLLTLNVFVNPPTYSIEDTTICEGEPVFAWNSHMVQTDRDSIYLDTLVNAAGCDSLLTLNVFVTPPTYSFDTMDICEGSGPIAWNNRTILSTVDSVYLDTLVNAAGCDSMLTMHVTILPVNDTIIDTALCTGIPAYVWNGLTVVSDKDSTYEALLTNQYGCDSVVTLNVTILSPTYSVEDTTLCEGEPVFAWNSHTVQTDRDSVYLDTLVDAAGCDSLLTLNVFVNPPTYSIEDTTICEGEPVFAWNSHMVQTDRDSIYLDTLVNAAGCDSLLTLNVFVTPPTYSFDTMDICEGSGPIAWNNRTILSTVDSVYLDTLVNAAGCDSMLTMHVTILPVNDTIIDTTLCTGIPAYVWNGLTVVSDKDSTYEALLTNQYGCDSVVTLNVTILSPTYSIKDTTLCEGEPVFAWNSHTVQTDRDGVYLDTLINAAGCDSLLTLNVFVNPPTYSIVDTTICVGAPVFTWNSHMVQTDRDSIYLDTLVNAAGCDSMLTLNVHIIPPSYTTETMDLCLGAPSVPWNSYTIVSSTDSSYVATLKNSEGCDSVVTMNVTILYPTYSYDTVRICENEPDFDWNGNTVLADQDGVYYATLVNAVGCDSLLTLSVESMPISEFEMDTTLCAGAPDFNWNGQTVTTNQDDVYQATLVNAFGCDSLVTLNVYVLPPDTTFIDTVLCEGSPEFIWYGNTVQTVIDDEYETRLSNRLGCDSLITLSVQIIPATDTIIDTMLCYDTPPFAWNHRMIFAEYDSTYLDTLVNQYGCDSLLTLNVTVIYPDTVNLDTTLCEDSPAFAWGTNSTYIIDTYIDSLYADTLQNQFGCDSIVNLDVKILRPVVITDTIEVCANEPAFTWHSFSVSTDVDSMYADTLYYKAGCDSLRLQLTLISNPVTDTMIFDTLCEGSPEFAWNNVWIQTDYSQIYLDTLYGANQYGCDSFLTYDVTIVPAFKDTLADVYCYGDPIVDWFGITISNEEDSTYVYNKPGPSGCDTLIYYEVTINPVTDTILDTTLCYGLDDFMWNNRLISGTVGGTYLDTLDNSFGCDSLLTYNVTILPPDTIRMDTVLCVGDPEYNWNGYTVSTTIENVYEATLQTGLGCDSIVILTTTLIDGASTYDTVYACVEYYWEAKDETYTVTGDDYRVLGTGTACPDTSWLHVVISNPLIIADSVNVLCYGDSTGSIDIEVSGGVEPYSYLWSNGETTQDISGLPAGTYTVTVTDALDCSASMGITITQPDSILITLDLITDVLVIGDSTGSIEVSVGGGIPGYDYAWINEADDTVGINEDLFNQPAGEYTIIVTDANACETSETYQILEPEITPCLDDVTLICYEDLANYPVAKTLEDYIALMAPGQEIDPGCGIDTASFKADSMVIAGSAFCYEEIRYYTLFDQCNGDTIFYCEQRVVVNDLVPPTISCPPEITVADGVVPGVYADTAEFIAAGGSFDDNCGVVSFRWVSDVSDGGTDPEIVTRTYEVADYCGNVATCTQQIEIYLTANFVIECGGLPSESFECRGDIPRYNTLQQFIDDGGYAFSYPYDIDSFWVADVSNGSTCPEVITRTFYIRNESGATENCRKTYRVDDETPPVFTLPPKEFADCEAANVWMSELRNLYRTGLDVRRYGGGTISDNCLDMRDEYVWYMNQITIQESCPTILGRVYRTKDVCNDWVYAIDTLIIYDTIPPVVNSNFPTEITAECDVPEPYTEVSGFVSDDCSPIEISYRDSLGGIKEPGVLYRFYTFTDGCNPVEVVQKITIELTNTPVFEGLSPLCQFTPSPELPNTSVNGITGYWDVDSIPTDVAGTFDYIFYPDSGQCAGPTSITVVIVPAIDLAATVVDQGYDPNPVGSIDLEIFDGAGQYTINWTGPDGYSATTEDIADLYAGEYRVEVSDNIGCYDSLSVTLRANQPEFSCPPDTAIECPDPANYPVATNIAEFIAYGGTYEPQSLVADIRSFDGVGDRDSCLSVDRYYVVEDIYGRIDTCVQRVDFYDNIPPVLIVPEGDTAECLSTVVPNISSFAEFVSIGGSAEDPNCELDYSTFTVRDTAIVLGTGRSQVIFYYSIADFCGNVAYDTTYYLITDDQAPEVWCADITVYLNAEGTYVLTVQDSVAMIDSMYDNCTAPEDMKVFLELGNITCEDIEGGTQARVIVFDEAGLSAECFANITIVDTVPPEAICQDITVYLDVNGEVTITAEQINNTSTDNCEIASIDISRDRFDCTDVGVNVVQLIVTDIYGNTDTCEANVTVIDEIPPQITCITGDTIQLSEEDGTFLLTWNFVTNSVWDECGIDTVLLDQYLLDCDNIGRTTITATAYDVNGNSTSCTSEFVIIGNTPPNVQNDSAITAVNIPIDINVVLNDYDLKTNINISTLGVTVGARNGSVEVDNTTGIATYTPNPGYVGTDIFMYSICDDGIPCKPECGQAIVFITVRPANMPPIAEDDYFDVPCISLTGNVAFNDSDPDGDDFVVDPVPLTPPTNGTLVLYEDGHFEYEPFIDFTEGIDSFQYQIWDEPLVGPSLYDTAWVYITRVADNDCDGVADVADIDDDNDGIRDSIENGGYWPEDTDVILIDSDQDGIPDYLDIDADNDGIVDNIEGQDEHNYIEPDGWRDDNNNGWDDRYDNLDGETGFPFDENLTDTDGDGIPDYLDSDSDNDNVPDYIEGNDDNADGIPDFIRFYSDLDRDGLDDAYDWVDGWGYPDLVDNETGSIAPLQDFDGDGWRDWRDVNDEDDEYLTRDEDINGNGDYSDDDLDLDGHPEYLDTEMECELFIPEGFSPNDDGVHDFFQILCIYPRYPDAKMMIFNRNGQLIWQKEKYGNYDYWGWNDAWWWGTSDNKFTLGRSGGLPAGNYIYVLELNDGRGTVHNGTVMIAY